MTIRYYLIPGILSCLLITAGVANAQRGGGGHGGGGHAGGGHAGGAHMGAAHMGGAAHYGAAHYNGAHYGGTRIIYGGGYYGGLGYGGLYGYGYGSPYLYGGGLYNYGYGGSSLYSSPQYSYYSAPQAPIVQDAPPVETPKNAQVKVLVPTEDAKVWFDGNPTTSTGTERIYHTPDLSPTATNSYRIRASWVANGKQVVQEQVITVAPGRGTIVDFTRPLPESVAPPPKE